MEKCSKVQKILELNGNCVAVNLEGCILSVKDNPHFNFTKEEIQFQLQGVSYSLLLYNFFLNCYFL